MSGAVDIVRLLAAAALIVAVVVGWPTFVCLLLAAVVTVGFIVAHGRDLA